MSRKSRGSSLDYNHHNPKKKKPQKSPRSFRAGCRIFFREQTQILFRGLLKSIWIDVPKVKTIFISAKNFIFIAVRQPMQNMKDPLRVFLVSSRKLRDEMFKRIRQIHISSEDIAKQCEITGDQYFTYWLYYKIHNWSMNDIHITIDQMYAVLNGLGIRVDEIEMENEKKYFIVVQPVEYIGLRAKRYLKSKRLIPIKRTPR